MNASQQKENAMSKEVIIADFMETETIHALAASVDNFEVVFANYERDDEGAETALSIHADWTSKAVKDAVLGVLGYVLDKEGEKLVIKCSCSAAPEHAAEEAKSFLNSIGFEEDTENAKHFVFTGSQSDAEKVKKAADVVDVVIEKEAA